jgi:hypothetical protein
MKQVLLFLSIVNMVFISCLPNDPEEIISGKEYFIE